MGRSEKIILATTFAVALTLPFVSEFALARVIEAQSAQIEADRSADVASISPVAETVSPTSLAAASENDPS